jgi:hypothetical protein
VRAGASEAAAEHSGNRLEPASHAPQPPTYDGPHVGTAFKGHGGPVASATKFLIPNQAAPSEATERDIEEPLDAAGAKHPSTAAANRKRKSEVQQMLASVNLMEPRRVGRGIIKLGGWSTSQATADVQAKVAERLDQTGRQSQADMNKVCFLASCILSSHILSSCILSACILSSCILVSQDAVTLLIVVP